VRKYSDISLERLCTCHSKLQVLFKTVLADADHSIICGHRGEADQELAFSSGKSLVHFPHSKHNVYPSRAVDVAPWPIDWADIDRFKAFSETVKCRANELGIRVVWGGDWDGFKDWPHWELHKEEV
jgi:peptidoglycan L-alanyl-D-glutamate endopeptidase CwlK